MLVCNVSIRPQRSAIAADLVEAGAATDAPTASTAFGRLIDEPVSASDTLSAFVGHIMVEAASASDTTNAGLILAVAINEPAAATDTSEATYAGGIAADVVEAATATDTPDATVVAAPSDDWTLVNSWTYSTPVAQVDFTGLAGYTEIRVVLDSVSPSLTGERRLLVSTDNGSTFMTSSGDYIEVDAAGTETAFSYLGINSASSSNARSGEIIISGWNLTANKNVEFRTRTNSHHAVIPTTSALNALRINNSTGNLTGGSIYVFAR